MCPFCGKTYKRLKSHLPHCKAAASSRSRPASKTSSSQLESSTTKEERSGQTLTVNAKPKSKKSKKVSVVSSTATLQSEDASLQSLSMSSSIATIKKKQKLSEQIKVATVAPSTSVSPSLPPTTGKLKKKSVAHLSEAAKSEQGSREPSEGIRSTQRKTKIKPEKVTASSGFLSNDTNTIPSEMEVSEMKTAAQVLSSTKDSARPHAENSILINREGEIKDLSESGSGHQSKITLQDVKAVLGRAKNTSQSSRPSIMSQVRASGLSSKIKPSSSFSLAPLQTGNQEDQLPSASLQTASKSKQASLIPLQHDSSPQFVPMSPSSPVLPGYLSSQVSHHMTGLAAISPLITPLPTTKMLVEQVEPLKADDGLTMGKSHLGVRNQISANNQTQGQYFSVKFRGLVSVKLPNFYRQYILTVYL